MSGERAEDLYDSMSEFEELLEDAGMQASDDNSEKFVKEVKANYDKWGLRMFLSDKQNNWLKRIAGWD